MKPVFVVLASMVCATVGVAAISRPGEAQSLAPLAKWVRKGAKQSVIRGRILVAMNLPLQDMPVRERGFRYEGERLTHVCSLSSLPAYADLMLFAQVDESNGDGTVWRTGFDGILVSTVRFYEGVVQRVSNEEFKAVFDFEKMIFTTRMPDHRGGKPPDQSKPPS
jgi:hypothetical protein